MPERRDDAGWRRAARTAGCCVALGLTLACQPGSAPEASDIIVRIAGEEIRYQRFENVLRESLASADLPLDAQVQSRLFDQFLDGELLMRLAVERGLRDQEITPRRAVAFLLRSAPRGPVTDRELRQYYDAHRGEFKRPARVHLQQILHEDETEAQRALDALRRGEPFAEVAARFSQGPKAHLGGDQGWLPVDKLTPDFAEAISELEAGEISGLISAEYGYHIFRVGERLPAETVPFENVEEQIRLALQRRHEDEVLASLIEEGWRRYAIQIYPENLPFQYEGEYATPTD